MIPLQVPHNSFFALDLTPVIEKFARNAMRDVDPYFRFHKLF